LGPYGAPNLKKKPSMKKIKDGEDEPVGEIPAYIYATYKYKPSLYYENIKQSYEQRLYSDTVALIDQKEKQGRLNTQIDNLDSLVKIAADKKNTAISSFEHMMGAALRESYWQPEDEY